MCRLFSYGLSAFAMIALTMCSDMSTPKTAEAPKVPDSEVENLVKSRFDADPSLRAAGLGVDADMAENKITLSGSVPTQEMRTRAVEIAKSSYAGVTITDKIDVKPGEIALRDYTEDMAKTAREQARATGHKLGESLEDAWIHTKITSKLIADGDTPSRTINVDVVNNVVTLRGKVDSAEARNEAERIAKSTEGVLRVNNRLTVETASR